MQAVLDLMQYERQFVDLELIAERHAGKVGKVVRVLKQPIKQGDRYLGSNLEVIDFHGPRLVRAAIRGLRWL